MQVLMRFWNDDVGVVVSAELVLIATILVIGMIVGLTTVRDQVVQELGDVASAIASINQSYSFSGATGHHSSTAGSDYRDLSDDCDGTDTAGAPPACIDVCGIDSSAEGSGS
ncbi:MAG: hypothetical protein VB853_03365 [Pirellulales bacterium]